jgi:SAM-dependent methyltransferase
VSRLAEILPSRARAATRRVVLPLALPVIGRVQNRRLRHLSDRERWERELGTEVRFWQTYLGELAGEDQTNYQRPDYDWSEEPVYAAVIDRLPDGPLQILDVGAGPMTAMPKVHAGKQITITAFDPLADEYNARLGELGIEPLVRTHRSTGEELLEHVAAGTFDLAHASNCLDHAYDPGLAVRNMVTAVRPGGLVLLRHERNEAVNEHYLGLHQWNFDVDGDDFILWRPGTRRNLSEELRGLATTEVTQHGVEIVALFVRHAAG